jgi:hypothetical protein
MNLGPGLRREGGGSGEPFLMAREQVQERRDIAPHARV